MARNTGKRKFSGGLGPLMWYWIAVLSGTLLFRFSGIVDVETPLGMLKALGIITAAFLLLQVLIKLVRKPG